MFGGRSNDFTCCFHKPFFTNIVLGPKAYVSIFMTGLFKGNLFCSCFVFGNDEKAFCFTIPTMPLIPLKKEKEIIYDCGLSVKIFKNYFFIIQIIYKIVNVDNLTNGLQGLNL